jgi:hypothetical protein
MTLLHNIRRLSAAAALPRTVAKPDGCERTGPGSNTNWSTVCPVKLGPTRSTTGARCPWWR